jgi:hypothetical protein
VALYSPPVRGELTISESGPGRTSAEVPQIKQVWATSAILQIRASQFSRQMTHTAWRPSNVELPQHDRKDVFAAKLKRDELARFGRFQPLDKIRRNVHGELPANRPVCAGPMSALLERAHSFLEWPENEMPYGMIMWPASKARDVHNSDTMNFACSLSPDPIHDDRLHIRRVEQFRLWV